MKGRFKPRHRRADLTPEITAAWVRFLRHAEKAVKNAERHGAAFTRAAERVNKLPLPPSQNDKGSDLVKLVRLGKSFVALRGEARDEGVTTAQRLAVACRTLFEPTAGASATAEKSEAREPRRDIFG